MGVKIDGLFTELIRLILLAGYARRDQKYSIVFQASATLDLLKFFLTLAWDIKMLDHKKYALLATSLSEVGKMIGGWRKQLGNEPPPAGAGGVR